MAQTLSGPVAQPRSVPLAYTNSGQQGLKQTLAALELLDKYAEDIFSRITQQVASQRQRVGTLGERAEAAAGQVKQLSEQKKGATVLCPSSFPKPVDAPSSEDIYFSPEAMMSAASGNYRPAPRPTHPQGIKEVEEFEGSSHSTMLLTRPEEDFLFETFLPEGSAKKRGASKGLGKLPSGLPSVSSLLLFNTSENPYNEYRTLDPLEYNTEKAKRGAGQGQGNDGAGFMNLDQDLPENTEVFKCDFVPHLKDTPGFELPDVVPGLDGVADVEWEMDFDWEPIAPSGSKNDEWNSEVEQIGQEAPTQPSTSLPTPPTPPVSIPAPTPPTIPTPGPSAAAHTAHNLPVPPPLPAPLRMQPPPLPVEPQQAPQQPPPLPAPRPTPPTISPSPDKAPVTAMGPPNPNPPTSSAPPVTSGIPTPPPLPPVHTRPSGPPQPPPRPPVMRLGGSDKASDPAPTGPLRMELAQTRPQAKPTPPAEAKPSAGAPSAPGGLLAEIEALRDQKGGGVLKPASERPKKDKPMSQLEEILKVRREGFLGKNCGDESDEEEGQGRAPPAPRRNRIPMPPKPKAQAPPPPPSRMFSRIQDNTPKEEADPEWD